MGPQYSEVTISELDERAFQDRRAAMVTRQLTGRGIVDKAVLRAMAQVPRERFVPHDLEAAAYEDRAVPLDMGQTVSQPYMVAVMTQALGTLPGQRVLEVGTGSGYQTAVLSSIASHVYTVERIPGLGHRAETVLSELGHTNVSYRIGDGTLGWPEEAPFDAILVTAGAPVAPTTLKEQVSADGGRLVIPVGPPSMQKLLRFTRTGQEFVVEALMSCRFVPLLGSEGW